MATVKNIRAGEAVAELKLVRRSDGWWIVGMPAECDVQEYGPYRTRDEADDDRRGVERWFKANWK
jgi:hypothetical protein